MDLKLLLLSALLLLICQSRAQQEGSYCIKANAKSCGECIQVGEKCGWCTDPDFLKQGEPTSARCDELDSLKKKGCAVDSIENPRGSVTVNVNKNVTNRKDKSEKVEPHDITQIQPQRITLNFRSGGSGIYMYMPALQDGKEREVARLVSPAVSGPGSGLCVSFWYHMFGSHVGALRVKQRKDLEDGRVDTLLWTVSGHQSSDWREARVLVPYSTTPYQVVIEGVMESKSMGNIAVDDIKILDGLDMTDCKDPDAPTEETQPEPEDSTILVDYTGSVESSMENSEMSSTGNMLKTLDPILITIIAMSALGVFLGAICRVVLNTMADRNLSALKNYYFELVDWVKLKKGKLNSYSEV